MMIKRIQTIMVLILVLLIGLHGQTEDKPWDELAEMYKCPDWFRDAKFGIWFHWGPQSVPEQGGGWYARHMYMKDVGRQKFGKMANPYHLQTYGHPSEFGFKDIIHSWKAENFDAPALINYAKKNGAKYIVALANHHDHYDLFNSTHHPWNSVNIGPRRDIIGEFAEATRDQNMKFGVTSHDNRFLSWWLPAFGSDESGDYKDVPYDGNLTKEDGKGTWWEGYDPADLHGPPPASRTPEIIDGIKENWKDRHLELVDKYRPDILYYDGFGFTYGDKGKAVSARLYNNSLRDQGFIDAVMLLKAPVKGTVTEVESGGSNTLRAEPWQSEITFTDWFYKKDRHLTHNARTILEMLIEAVSKNGNLLLNIELNPDGTIPPEQRVIIDLVGDWLRLNGEAIYDTRPWIVYGDGTSLRTEKEVESNVEIRNAGNDIVKKKKAGEHYNQRTTASPLFASDEVRFTRKEDRFYIIVLNPEPGDLIIPSLGLSKDSSPGRFTLIKDINNGASVSFEQNSESCNVQIPKLNGRSYPLVLMANLEKDTTKK